MAPKFLRSPGAFLDESLRRPSVNAQKYSRNSTELADIDRQLAEVNARQAELAEISRRHQQQNRMIDPATTAEAKSLKDQGAALSARKMEIQKQNADLEPYANQREIKPGVKVAGGLAATAGAAVGGGALVLRSLKKKDPNSPGGTSGNGSSGNSSTQPSDQNGWKLPPVTGGNGSLTPGTNAQAEADKARQDAINLTHDIVKHNQSRTSPEYLDRISRDAARNALLLGGAGAGLTSAQTSEAIAANVELGYENNNLQRFKTLVDAETRERGDIRNQQTEMLRAGLGTLSDYIRSKHAMQGQVMGSFAQGLSGLYQNYNQVEPVRVEFNPSISSAQPANYTRNNNLISGFR